MPRTTRPDCELPAAALPAPVKLSGETAERYQEAIAHTGASQAEAATPGRMGCHCHAAHRAWWLPARPNNFELIAERKISVLFATTPRQSDLAESGCRDRFPSKPTAGASAFPSASGFFRFSPGGRSVGRSEWLRPASPPAGKHRLAKTGGDGLGRAQNILRHSRRGILHGSRIATTHRHLDSAESGCRPSFSAPQAGAPP